MRSQHVNRGNNHTPEGQDGRNLKKVELLHFPAVTKCPEENHDLGSEIGKTGKTDGRERAEPEREPRKWHCFGKTAEFAEGEGAGSIANMAGYGKQQRNRQTMCKHQRGG